MIKLQLLGRFSPSGNNGKLSFTLKVQSSSCQECKQDKRSSLCYVTTVCSNDHKLELCDFKIVTSSRKLKGDRHMVALVCFPEGFIWGHEFEKVRPFTVFNSHFRGSGLDSS